MINQISIPAGAARISPLTELGNPSLVSIDELRCLLWFSRLAEGNIVEIGCRRGATLLNLAFFNPSKIAWGVDWTANAGLLPEQRHERPDALEVGGNAKYLPNVRIRDINSASFDYSQAAPVGFIFIDGDHSDEGVRRDSELALAAITSARAGRRFLLWHDFHIHEMTLPSWCGVSRYIAGLTGRFAIDHIMGTNLAVLRIGGC